MRSSTLLVLVQRTRPGPLRALIKAALCDAVMFFEQGDSFVDGLLVLSRVPEALDKDGVFLRVFRLPAIEPEGGWGEDKQEKD
ncbi:MAG TPA: hypothetical protein EYQ18_02725 [Candidatus Handelsmanbacteria bacterium]|nr:hypothetical protein [Candidatus Handelsmanbacteria bacterium]